MTQATFQHKDKQPSDKSDAREFSEGEKKKKNGRRAGRLREHS